MCGIVAAIDPSGTLDERIVDAMRDRLAHRGPDGAATRMFSSGGARIGLGHRRLAILDLSAAASQPMEHTSGGPVLVHNGEIYDFVELRVELEALGHRFRTTGDSEVLLAAYEQWGSDCVSRFNGMFAFAIWDPAKAQLFVARDRFGEKPLFQARFASGGIAFASEMKALFAHPGIEASTDPDAVEGFLSGDFRDGTDKTLFRGIERVPAAGALTVDARGNITRAWRWWTPRLTAPAPHDPREAVERFRELMRRSATMRLRADVPVGTSLSGGLDSSFIVGLLSGERRAGSLVAQNSFSARFDDDPAISEGPFIDEVVARNGVRPFFVTPSPQRLMEESAALHWHQEEPFSSASIYLQWCVMRLALQEKTTILLDGQGADELLGGYQAWFRVFQLDLLDERRIGAFLRETLAFSRRLKKAVLAWPDGRRRFDPGIAMPVRAGMRRALFREPLPPKSVRAGVPEPVRGGRLRALIAEELQYGSLPRLLRYADRNAMAFGRETRFPFLDYDLVDFCLELPEDVLVRDGWQKWILREAGEGILPRSVQWRADKVGYAAPLDRWLQNELREWARVRLFEGPIREIPSWNESEIARIWAGGNAWEIWKWVSVSEWLALSGEWKRGFRPPTS